MPATLPPEMKEATEPKTVLAKPPTVAEKSGTGHLRRVELLVAGSLRRNPPHGKAARAVFWLGWAVAALLLLRLAHLWRGTGSDVLLFFLLVPLVPLSLILLWRWTFRHLLWRVRNRLIVTYLLMGLAPVVLFATLATIAAYLFAGQFATFAAIQELTAQEQRLSAENRGFAIHLGHILGKDPGLRSLDMPEAEMAADVASLSGQRVPPARMAEQGMAVSAESDGHPVALLSGGRAIGGTLRRPAWAEPGFHELVLDRGRLYLRAIDSHSMNGHTAVVVSSQPVTDAMLERMAKGLGRILIAPGFSHLDDDTDPEAKSAAAHEFPAPSAKPGRDASRDTDPDDGPRLAGGTLPAPTNFYDRQVLFSAPLAVVDWQTGEREPSRLLLSVRSRPTLLYQRLFGNSVQVGAIVRDALITIAVVFGLLELFAFAMAIGLNRTITRSINDLYAATRAIDSGDFEHRIVVKRRDQLAALSTSFNAMAASLADLLKQQREKERLQSELAIAHEVQNSLLPQEQIRLPMLEVHGVSKPARAVSGDYYDFLFTGASQLCLALGDISGKGISAALLMASLHSAVRAYRFGDSGSGADPLTGEDNLLAHPALMLERLNRHLYTSTQPEKYATLFLAHYDGADRTLTYSTGGQLPPLVLCADGEVKRLDCGGSVVGLLDGMKYEQATVSLAPGDILIVYSDGVTEPENEFGDFGEDRLLDLVRRNRSQSLEGISRSVMQALTHWIGDQEQPDDITLVLARQL